jgi:hypothetical protein
MATVKEFTRMGLGPQTHAYDDPDLSPLEFLQAVYRDPLLPMSTRIDAARGLLPYTEPRPMNSVIDCKVVIGGLGSSPEDPEQIVGETQSKSVGAEPSSGTPGPLCTEMNSNPLYSEPPSPEEIEQIKAAVLALHPDADLSQLPEPRLCECGHWMFYPCKCTSVH